MLRLSRSISVSETTEETALLKFHVKFKEVTEKSCKNDLIPNQIYTYLILMESENLWIVEPNALKNRTIM